MPDIQDAGSVPQPDTTLRAPVAESAPTTVAQAPTPAAPTAARFQNQLGLGVFGNAIDNLAGIAKGLYHIGKAAAFDIPVGLAKAGWRAINGDNLFTSVKEETGIAPEFYNPLWASTAGIVHSYNIFKNILSGKDTQQSMDEHLGWRTAQMVRGMADSIGEYRDPLAKLWNHPIDVLMDSTVFVPMLGEGTLAAKGAFEAAGASRMARMSETVGSHLTRWPEQLGTLKTDIGDLFKRVPGIKGLLDQYALNKEDRLPLNDIMDARAKRLNWENSDHEFVGNIVKGMKPETLEKFPQYLEQGALPEGLDPMEVQKFEALRKHGIDKEAAMVGAGALRQDVANARIWSGYITDLMQNGVPIRGWSIVKDPMGVPHAMITDMAEAGRAVIQLRKWMADSPWIMGAEQEKAFAKLNRANPQEELRLEQARRDRGMAVQGQPVPIPKFAETKEMIPSAELANITKIESAPLPREKIDPMDAMHIVMAPPQVAYYPHLHNAASVSPLASWGSRFGGTIKSALRTLMKPFGGSEAPKDVVTAMAEHDRRFRQWESSVQTVERLDRRFRMANDPNYTDLRPVLGELSANVKAGAMSAEEATIELQETVGERYVWTPDETLRGIKSQLEIEDGILRDAHLGGKLDNDAIKQSVQKNISEWAMRVWTNRVAAADGRVWALPKGAARLIAGELDNPGSWGLIHSVFSTANSALKAMILTMNPAFYFHTMVGRSVYSIMSGANPLNILKAMKDNWRNYLGDELHEHIAQAVESSIADPSKMGVMGRIERTFGGFHDKIDNLFRRHVLLEYAKNHSLRQLDGAATAGYQAFDLLDEQGNKLPSALSDEAKHMLQTRDWLSNPVNLQTAVDHVNKFMINYNHLHPFERQLLRDVFPFYVFLRHQNTLLFSMIGSHPQYYSGLTRAAIGAANDQQLPDWLDGTIPIGGTADGSLLFMSVRGANPFSGFMNLDDTRILGMMNPIIKAGLELVGGKNVWSKRTMKPGEPIADYAGNKYTASVNQQGLVALQKTLTGLSPGSVIWDQFKPNWVKGFELLLHPNVRQADGSYRPMDFDANTAMTVSQAIMKFMGFSTSQFNAKMEVSHEARVRRGIERELMGRIKGAIDPAERTQYIDMLKGVAMGMPIEGAWRPAAGSRYGTSVGNSPR